MELIGQRPRAQMQKATGTVPFPQVALLRVYEEQLFLQEKLRWERWSTGRSGNGTGAVAFVFLSLLL